VAIAARYNGYRYPIEVIGHAVWLYHRFALSLRDVEELRLARGVVVSHETIRSWCAKFGPNYAARLCRRGPRPGDKWHFDEEFVKINGAPLPVARGRLARQRVRHLGAVAPRRGGGSLSVTITRGTGPLSGRCPRAFAVGDPSPRDVPHRLVRRRRRSHVATVPTDPFVDVVVQVHFEVVPKNRSIFRGAWDRPVG